MPEELWCYDRIVFEKPEGCEALEAATKRIAELEAEIDMRHAALQRARARLVVTDEMVERGMRGFVLCQPPSTEKYRTRAKFRAGFEAALQQEETT